MLWAEEAARAEHRGENELSRSEEQKGALWLLEPGGCSRQRGAGGAFTDSLPGHREASHSSQKVTAEVLIRGGDICKRSFWVQGGKWSGWSKNGRKEWERRPLNVPMRGTWEEPMEMERRGQVQALSWRRNQQDRLIFLKRRGAWGNQGSGELGSWAERMSFSKQKTAGEGRDVALGKGIET